MNQSDHPCLVCDRLSQVNAGVNPSFVLSMEMGVAVIGDFQFFPGYALLLCKSHVTELHQLSWNDRTTYLQEVSILAEAVHRAFSPRKINIEMLGNTEPHLHCHVFPRYENDPNPLHPVWSIDRAVRCDESARPSAEKLAGMRVRLKDALITVAEEHQYFI